MSGKYALIIANSDYDDAQLRKLVTPEQDAAGLEEVLRAPEIGGFDEVQVKLNATKEVVERAIEELFSLRKQDDLLLFYFSGHGIRDSQGRLYFAVTNTRTRRDGIWSSTAIAAQTIAGYMKDSRSRKQVLLLDCCHSGAFEEGVKAGNINSGIQKAFEGDGHGHWVITATDAIQYAWEGDRVTDGKLGRSVFTRHLVDGLRTGDADVNRDGLVTLEELYQYLHRQVCDSGAKQTPCKWTYKQKGDVVIARNPCPVATMLPIEILELLRNPFSSARVAAIAELARLTQENDTDRAELAGEHLRQMAVNDDNPEVRHAAAAKVPKRKSGPHRDWRPAWTATTVMLLFASIILRVRYPDQQNEWLTFDKCDFRNAAAVSPNGKELWAVPTRTLLHSEDGARTWELEWGGISSLALVRDGGLLVSIAEERQGLPAPGSTSGHYTTGSTVQSPPCSPAEY